MTLKQDHRIAVIVVTYNAIGTIEKCLDSIEESSISPALVLVVDNGSTDGTVDFLKNRNSVRLLESGSNLGFGGGCNSGISAALEDGAKELLFVNPDASLERSCLEELVKGLEDHETACVASPLILAEPSGHIWYAGANYDIGHSDFDHIGQGQELSSEFLDTKVTGRPTGCVMLIRASGIKKHGVFDPSYFLYWEECELFSRLSSSGEYALFVGAARAHHKVSTSTGGAGSALYEYYYLRNWARFLSEAQDRGKLKALLTMARKVVGRWAHLVKRLGIKRGISIVVIGLLGIRDFWIGRTGYVSRRGK